MALLECRVLRLGQLAGILLVFALTRQVYAAGGADNSPVEYQVKAAFLFNFAKFVEWPRESFKNPTDPIKLCILGHSPISRPLEETVRDKRFEDRPFTVREFAEVRQAANCHVLFVSASEQIHLRAILDATKSNNVLTVGETSGFAAAGGVVGFSLDEGRIRFDVNLRAAQLQRLRISSKLCNLASSVTKAEK